MLSRDKEEREMNYTKDEPRERREQTSIPLLDVIEKE